MKIVQYQILIYYFFIVYSIPNIYAQPNIEQIADSLSSIGDYESANAHYDQLKETALFKNDVINYSNYTLKYAINLQKLRRYKEALDPLQEVIEKSKTIIQLDSTRALAFHKQGVSHYYLKNRKIATESYRKALEIRSRLYSDNHIDILKGNRNIGVILLLEEEYENALEYLQKSLSLQKTVLSVDSILLARTYTDIGTAYSNLDNFNQAETHLIIALELYKILYKNTPRKLGHIFNKIIIFYYKQAAYYDLIQFTKNALLTFQKIKEKKERDYWEIAHFNNNLGLGYRSIDSLELSISCYQRAIEINRNYYSKRASFLSINYNNLAIVYRLKKDFKRALKYIDIAIEINKEKNNNTALAGNLSNVADIYSDQKDFQKALSFQQQSLKYLLPSFHFQDDYKNPPINIIRDRPTLIESLNDKAKTLKNLAVVKEQEKNLEAAKNTYDLLIQLIDQVRFSFESDASKQFLAKNAKDIIENAIEVYSELYKIDKDPNYLNTIFHLIERSKSGILLDALAETDAQTKAGVPIHFVNRERHLKKEISGLEANIKEEASTENLENREKIILFNRQLDKLIDTLKTNYPKYHQLKYAVAEVTLNDIELNSNQGILNYFIGKKNSYLFFISKKKTTLIQLDPNFPLEKSVKQLQDNLLGYHLSNKRSEQLFQQNADTLSRVSYDLYQQLIAPIEALTKLPEELIVMPDGVLGYLPFELLLKAQPTNVIAFSAYPYLLKEHSIYYNYSVALWQQMLEQVPTKANNNFIAFAPTFKSMERPKDIAGLRRDLGALIYNVPEVEAIQEIIGGQIYINEAATKNKFLEKAHAHRIVHLATHGKADEASGDNAYLAFFKEDSTSNALLTNLDLYNTVLPVDMVVLSACETGIGALQNGEGIMSLARGFSYAGAKSIIPSLWSVNDQTTMELMASFYTYLQAGKAKDTALRQAKLDFLNAHPHQDAHPFYWAAFIAIGDMEVLDLSNKYQWCKIGLGIGTLFLFLLLFRKSGEGLLARIFKKSTA